MGKGLYHCSTCKAHFYDAEATAMHIKDKHKGDGEVLRHPTKRELIIRDEQQRARIEELEAKLARTVEAIEEAHQEMLDSCDSDAFLILQATLEELKGKKT